VIKEVILMETREQHDRGHSQRATSGEGKKPRENFREKLESNLREWDTQIDKLRARAKVAQADLKIKYYRELKRLETMRDGLQGRFEDLKKSKDDAWVTLKSGTEKAMSELKQAIDKAIAKFK
jgi:predicted nuclease with TOPRIM domain